MKLTPVVPITEVVHIVMGQSPPGSTYNATGDGLPFFQGKAEFGHVSPTPRKWCSGPQRIAEAGDILLSVRAPVGPTNLAVERCCIGRGLAAIRADPRRLAPEYLRLYLRQMESTLASMGQGSTFAAIGRAEIASLRIWLPPLAEQHRIVDLLSRAEGIVRLRREAQQKAAELIPAIFIDMFGDPGTNPKRWPIEALGNLSEVQGGLQVARGRSGLPLTRPYLRVANVYRGQLDLSEIKTIELTAAELDRTRLQHGDLLVVEGHGNPEEVGRVAMWDGSIEDCTHQNHLIRARPSCDRLLPHYACALLNSAAGRQSLRRAGKTTSGLSTISAGNVRATSVMLPPLELQSAFARNVDGVNAFGRQQIAALNKAQAALAALLAQSFGG